MPKPPFNTIFRSHTVTRKFDCLRSYIVSDFFRTLDRQRLGRKKSRRRRQVGIAEGIVSRSWGGCNSQGGVKTPRIYDRERVNTNNLCLLLPDGAVTWNHYLPTVRALAVWRRTSDIISFFYLLLPVFTMAVNEVASATRFLQSRLKQRFGIEVGPFRSRISSSHSMPDLSSMK